MKIDDFVGGFVDRGEDAIGHAGGRQHRGAFNRILGAIGNQESKTESRNQEPRDGVSDAVGVSDRGNDRDAVSPRRRRSRRRHLGLYRPAARGAQEAEGVVVSPRALREDRGAAARSHPGVFRPAGGDHDRAGDARAAGLHLQSAQRRRNPADDSRARRRSSACRRRRRRWRNELERWTRPDPRRRGAAPAPAARLFRGVGQPAHLGHPVGRGADRDRRRRPGVSRAATARSSPRIASSRASR